MAVRIPIPGWCRGGVQNLMFKSDDVVVGTRGIANFAQGTGLITLTADTGTQINFQTGIDSAVVQTQAGHQSGATLLCASAGGSANTYSCSLSPALVAYSRGMVLNWIPDVNGAGGPTTVNVDALGPVPVKTGDGGSEPAAGDIIGGRMHTIWYDGSSFRLTSGGGTGGGGGTVVSVFGREGAVMPQAGDYTTDLVNEGTNNLYFTNARAQAAIANFTGDSGAGGARGTVPAPAAGDAAADKYLHANGTFKTVTAATLPSCMDTQESGYSAPLGELTYASGSLSRQSWRNQGILHQFNVCARLTCRQGYVSVAAASGYRFARAGRAGLSAGPGSIDVTAG